MKIMNIQKVNMKYDIHQTIEKVTTVLEGIENLSRDDLEFFNIYNYIKTFTRKNFDEHEDYDSLFDLIPYTEQAGIQYTAIKVCKKFIWYINHGFNVKIALDITEEQFFQQSTVQDFGDMIYETIINCNKLINILGKIHGNELRSKA